MTNTENNTAYSSRLIPFIKHNAVAVIALAAALVSVCFVPPDNSYGSYFDLKTLCCLFGTLAVVCALKNIHFFSIIAARIIRLTGSSRKAALTLIYITFIGSMLIANDMALITFLPLGYYVFSTAENKWEVALVFILQNIAANLGGMLTPFGNPQNLYMYTHYSIPTGEFIAIMAAPFAVSITLISLCCFMIPRHSLHVSVREGEDRLPPLRTGIYLFLFLLSILMVFRLIPPLIALSVVLAVLCFMDRRALKQVDYGLLFTFVCFFVFAGNMGRVEPVREFFRALLEKNTLLTGVVSCQLISNVPSAILLSCFTENYTSLLTAVNIGGAGTLIASLASLITFREFTGRYKNSSGGYILRFSLINFSFLALLTWFCLSIGR
ncbi:MAG: citrate transporter [Clostridiales bacterium]|nr:citrate transporter [Clostridiales bacterium]